MECSESFENMDDKTLKSFSAIIVPAGMVSDRLRYTENIDLLPPAAAFMQRAFAEKYNKRYYMPWDVAVGIGS